MNLDKEGRNKHIRRLKHALTKCIVTALSICWLTLNPSFAQTSPAPEQQVKAAYIYNFTRFVDWPLEAFRAADAPFVIGILGNDPVSTILDDLVKDEKIGDHNITVEHYTDLKQVGNCNILFISAEEAFKNSKLITSINRRGILTVSDVADFSKWGGIVRFYKEASKLRLQINPAEAKAAQLSISSKLLSISSIYKAK